MSADDCRPSVALLTLGCKVNQYDTEALAEALREAGWEVSFGLDEGGPDPDVVIVNSCVVTARAEAKSRQAARKAAKEHPGSRVVLAGCYPQVAPAAAGGVAGLAGTVGTGRQETVRLVQSLVGAEKPAARAGREARPDSFGPLPAEYESLPITARAGRVRAFLKVQEGCANDCAYCIVPLARGPERSRPLADAVEQARGLLAGGARELVLTGIRLGAYGTERGWAGGERAVAGGSGAAGERERAEARAALVDLVVACLELPGLVRVRLSSIEPTDIPPDLLAVMAADPRACPHLHVPLQSGSDSVLRRMGRRYDTAGYRAVIEDARRAVPGLAVSTDVMVGFPCETEAEFAETLAFVRRIGFTRLHVFPYSRRPGTAAAGMPGQVAARVRAERAKMLTQAGRELALSFHLGLVGRVEEVLVERQPKPLGRDAAEEPQAGDPASGIDTDARYVTEGLTARYVRVELLSSGKLALGDLVAARLVEARTGDMAGVAIDIRDKAGGVDRDTARA
ncbi:MAG: MiaB/RimO family radical SAM methylthiotransferase [Bacillota bacterium]|nr:MiaB/RimO family radical SAM methylthiotransferase [Bacillota bacterium]